MFGANELVKCKNVDFFIYGLTIILIKAYLSQTMSRISPIYRYCGSDRSVCGYTISFMSS